MGEKEAGRGEKEAGRKNLEQEKGSYLHVYMYVFCVYLFRKILLVDRDFVTSAGRMGSSRQNCSR